MKESKGYKPQNLLIQKNPKRCCTCMYWDMDWMNGRDWGDCALMTGDSEQPGEWFPGSKAKAYVIIPDVLTHQRAAVNTDWDFGCIQWEEDSAKAVNILKWMEKQ
jgi:hypothetical protein